MFGKQIKVSINHDLEPEDARDRMVGLAKGLRQVHGDKLKEIREQWNGMNARFFLAGTGFSVNLSLRVTSSAVLLEGKLPLLILHQKDEITTAIHDRVTELLRAEPEDQGYEELEIRN